MDEDIIEIKKETEKSGRPAGRVDKEPLFERNFESSPFIPREYQNYEKGLYGPRGA